MKRLAATVLALAALSALGQKAPPSSPPAEAASARAPETVTRSTRFAQLGARSLSLRADAPAATIDFGCRSDELVTRAVVRFRYVGSPALSTASHVRLSLNDNAIGTLAFPGAAAGTLIERDIEIDPRLLVGYNKLAMTLVATEGESAADAARPGLWADVTGASEIALTLQPLVVADDLAILPEPFFDPHDQRRVTVPFAFAATPSLPTLRAAAVVSSWIGRFARWRGARFPAALDAQPTGHAIAFVANAERPVFLASLPPAQGPELRLMTNPADGRSKLLVVMGRDGEDLKVAADALVSGAPLSGASVKVKQVADKGPLPAYEAPAWVPPDRPVKLGDLLDSPQQLESSGTAPDLPPVRVDLRMPPDIAAWRGPGVPMSIKVQYTPGACVHDAYLDVAVNDQLLQSVPLRVAREPIVETKELFIPFYRLGSRSELAFGFRFLLTDEGKCRDARAPVMKAIVLPESTLDFSGFPHYARMPNLAHFATIGFPFTRRADLSETVVVLPERPAAGDIETMLALMARMGEATGHAATRVRIATPKDAALLENADLLVIGAPPQQGLVDRWSDRMPISLSGYVRTAMASNARLDQVYDWLGFAAPPDTTVSTQVRFEGPGPVAAIYGFESPITRGRSVVAITAVVPDQLGRVVDALDERSMRRAVKGSAAFILADKVESVLVGPTYHVGFMPPWAGLGYWMSQNPEIVGGAATLLLMLAGYVAFLANNRLKAWRAGRRKA